MARLLCEASSNCTLHKLIQTIGTSFLKSEVKGTCRGNSALAVKMSERDPLQVTSSRYEREIHSRRRSKIILITLLSFLGILSLIFILIFTLQPTRDAESELSEQADETANPLLNLAFPLRASPPGSGKTSNLGLKEELVNDSIRKGRETLQKRKLLEDAMFRSNQTMQKGMSSFYHQNLINVTSEIKTLTEYAVMAEGSLQFFVERNISLNELQKFNTSLLVSSWPHCQVPTYITCDPLNKFRTLDGTCNNEAEPLLGSAVQPFRRILAPFYEDGLSKPRISIPARKVSTLLQRSTPGSSISVHQLSMLFLTWGQFLDHDITATASTKGVNGTGVVCCGIPVEQRHPECLPLEIPQEDSFMNSYSVKCMEFVRSAGAPQCSVASREQMNLASSYIDASMLYGLTRAEAGRLRAHRTGYLRAHLHPDGRWMLPISNKPEDGCNRPEYFEKSKYCFKSGDSRVNENTGLTSMHTIWMREHNTIATELADLNPHWDDDRIYHESRKIVIAEVQHITYNEFLPLLLGKELHKRLELKSARSGFFNGYDPQIDPAISNEFATAAYRFGHSMLQGLVALESKQGRNIEYVQLQKSLFNPFPLWDMSRLDDLVRGSAGQSPRVPDTTFSSQVTNHLFQPENASFGLDLFALNIQRGRDHGLAPYTYYRSICQLPKITGWSDLTTVFKQQSLELVQKVYTNVDDIDLYVGVLAEKPIKGGLLGPVSTCILADQFVRLKKGDRLWYENPGHFNKEQLAEVRRTTLARVLCENGDAMDAIQQKPLESVSSENPRISCTSNKLERMDFTLWEETRF